MNKMKHVLRVSMAQINTTVGDLGGNRQKVLRALAEAKKRRSHLVTFPELALTGYPPEDILFKKHFVSENIKALESILPHTQGTSVVIGFVDRDRKHRLYNAAAFIANKRIVHVYHKMLLPNYGVFDEQRYFSPGDRGGLVDLDGVRLGLTICEDIWQKDAYVYSKDFSGNVSVLINISASPYHRGKEKERQALLKHLALRTKSVVLYQNLVGGQDELVFDGGSMIVSEAGRVLCQAKRFEEDLLTVDVPIKKISAQTGSNLAMFMPASLPKNLLSCKLNRLMLRAKPKVLGHEEEVYKALLMGTHDYIRKNGFKKALIGLSGGVDSSLVARIAVDVVGPQNVLGVTLPSPYTSGETYADAKLLAKNLGIECLEFKIDEIFGNYLDLFKETFAQHPADSTEENLQARIRGNILMALSNKFGYLVLTTGNKSEMATGYCTLYGDMAGGFAVIKDVPKTWVFKLARYRNSLNPKNSIPLSVLRRAPSAELRPNQTDQDTLPPYELLDRFLELYVERDLSLDKIIKEGIPRAVAVKVAKMVDGNEYKRRQAPPGIKITPKAFGRDRRMPITNRYSS